MAKNAYMGSFTWRKSTRMVLLISSLMLYAMMHFLFPILMCVGEVGTGSHYRLRLGAPNDMLSGGMIHVAINQLGSISMAVG